MDYLLFYLISFGQKFMNTSTIVKNLADLHELPKKGSPSKSGPSTFLRGLYKTFRYCTIVILTILIMIPLIYLIGSQHTSFNEKPLYKVYDQNDYYISKSREVKDAISKKSITFVNLHSNSVDFDEGQIKTEYSQSWENLLDFAGYLAYNYGKKNVRIITREVDISKIPIEQKGKKNKKISKEVQFEKQQLLQKVYKLYQFTQSYVLKKKINNVAQRVIKRLGLKITSVDKLNEEDFYNKLTNTIISHVNIKSIWIIVIDNIEKQAISYQNLQSQIEKIQKQRHNDEFIVLSRYPVDLKNKKIAHIQLEIDQPELHGLKQQLYKQISQKLQLPNQHFSKNIFCKNNGSLLDINEFLLSCSQGNDNSCFNRIKQFSDYQLQNKQKFQNAQGLGNNLQHLCLKGKAKLISHSIYKRIYYQLGIDIQEIQGFSYLKWDNQVRQAYEIAHNVMCKSDQKTEACKLEWIDVDPKVQQQKKTKRKTEKDELKNNKKSEQIVKNQKNQQKQYEEIKISNKGSNVAQTNYKQKVKTTQQTSTNIQKDNIIATEISKNQHDKQEESEKKKDLKQQEDLQYTNKIISIQKEQQQVIQHKNQQKNVKPSAHDQTSQTAQQMVSNNQYNQNRQNSQQIKVKKIEIQVQQQQISPSIESSEQQIIDESSEEAQPEYVDNVELKTEKKQQDNQINSKDGDEDVGPYTTNKQATDRLIK